MKKAPYKLIPGHIRTASGKLINLLKLTSEMIDIQDIAHALANLCRFGGHTQKFYSVAQHSFEVYRRFCTGHEQAIPPAKDALACLLHDAAEAYFVDLPKPIKVLCPIYDLSEGLALQVIYKKFGITKPPTERIKEIDKEIGKLERLNCRDQWNGYFPEWEPGRAKVTFLETFHQLTNDKHRKQN